MPASGVLIRRSSTAQADSIDAPMVTFIIAIMIVLIILWISFVILYPAINCEKRICDVPVNYETPLEQLLASFTEVNQELTEQNYGNTGMPTVPIRLIRLSKAPAGKTIEVDTKTAIALLADQGYRPATLKETSALVRTGITSTGIIFALGSPLKIEGNMSAVPVIEKMPNGDTRAHPCGATVLCWPKGSNALFAAVPIQ